MRGGRTRRPGPAEGPLTPNPSPQTGEGSPHCAFRISQREKLMILLIDNYDSFTYNLVQRFGEIDPGIDLQVHRNDKITVEQIAALKPTHIIISPGPCTPREAGISN